MPKVSVINRFDGGLNLTQSTAIGDNQFTIAKNMYYNQDKQLETRRGFITFGNEIGSDPITSYYFFQRNDNKDRIAVCNSGTVFYEYDEGSTSWTSTQTGLTEFETLPGRTTERTRRDHAAYKNVIYMGNGVDTYASYDGTTYTEIGTSSVGTCTFDNTTEIITLTTHGLSDGNVVNFTTTGSLPAEITSGQYYYVINSQADPNEFQISTLLNGTALDFTDDGTPTTTCTKLTQPRVRYLHYLGKTMFAGGDDADPIKLYISDSEPTDMTDLTTDIIRVGSDDAGIINGIFNIGLTPLVFKDNRIYSVDVSTATPSVSEIDSQEGGFSNRSLFFVNNAVLFLAERGVDKVRYRQGVLGGQALETVALGEDVRQLTSQIATNTYNSNAAWYAKDLNNYYFSFDTNDDNIPDTTLVYSSAVDAWTQYTIPNLYTYGEYINSDNELQYIFGSAIGGQTYQFETGFDDNGATIDYEIETKKFDFKKPGLNKTFDYVDVIGLKAEGTEIQIQAKIDNEVESQATIDDTNINITSPVRVLSETPISDASLTGPTSTAGVPVYRYIFRLPMYATGTEIAVNMSSTGGLWILEQMRISSDDQPFEVFCADNIG